MLQFRTPGFKGFSTKYSPFFDNRIAVATGQNYGLVGNGRLYVLAITPNGEVQAERWYDTQDVLYDLAWAENNENQILVATGDGSIKLFDLTVKQFPVQVWQQHSREVFCVHWNLTTKETFLSSSWDGTVKIFNPLRDQAITVLPTRHCTYSAQFSPHDPGIVSAVSSDGNLRIFDLRTPASASNHLMMTVPLHSPPRAIPGVAPSKSMPPSEALTHDWNKYRGTVLAAGGVDRLIRTFDLRNISAGPLAVLPGHEFAVRRLSWSPHLSDVLLSASYDMTCRIWSDGTANGQAPPPAMANANVPGGEFKYGGGWEMGRMGEHTEFCTGVDWCMFGSEGWCATTGWDERVLIWDVRAFLSGT